MNREQALQLVKENIKNRNSIKHCLATEAIMIALAEHFNEDIKSWGLVGLLHDLDMELVDYIKEPEKHGLKTVEMLKDKGLDNVILEAIKAHNSATGKLHWFYLLKK